MQCQSWRLAALCSLTLSVSPISPVMAEIITDGSLGQAQTIAGPDYQIEEAVGQVAGNNLYHSFQVLNIAADEAATFTTSTPGIVNVLTRVTGGSASTIAGHLSLQPCDGCGAPNFFMINPAGLVFGEQATVNMPGVFHMGTAQEIIFDNGETFSADITQPSSLSIPSASITLPR